MRPAFNVLCLSLLNLGLASVNASIFIQTKNGKVKGKTIQTLWNNREIDTFFGIPFAKPPIGNLRFKRPEPLESWDGELDATTISKDCIQKDLTTLKRLFPFLNDVVNNPPFAEDCLKLNIWVPKTTDEKPLAVMVFFYGGAFDFGGADLPLYRGDIIASEGEVIMITLNYRVNSFGFLYLDHPDAPGNVGLLDQVMALGWIKENIAAFGGDPERITLFGQSAGSASVYYHYISPMSQHLFRRGIFQSGTPHRFMVYGDKELAIEATLELAKSVDCPSDLNDKDSILKCLRDIDPMDIADAGVTSYQGDLLPAFRPLNDGYFINDCPHKLFRKGMYKRTESLIGTVRDEGTLFFMTVSDEFVVNGKEVPNPTKESIIDGLVSRVPKLTEDLAEEILSRYFKSNDDDKIKNINSANRALSDLVFNCPAAEQQKILLSNGDPVYKYYFTHRSSISKFPEWMGTVHGAELPFVFGIPIFYSSHYTEAEVDLSRRIIAYWTNFAKTGNPNGNSKTPSWPIHTSSGEEYVVLCPNQTIVGHHYRDTQCQFWLDDLPSIVQRHGLNINITDTCDVEY